MRKLVLILTILTLGIGAIAADLVIDSKTQTYSEHGTARDGLGALSQSRRDVGRAGGTSRATDL